MAKQSDMAGSIQRHVHTYHERSTQCSFEQALNNL